MNALHTHGFVDLRVQGRGEGSYSDDSVWPSFTDIMTVVVMIFLMALVVILIRNVDLVQQLRATMEAERAAALTKDTLAVRIERLENLVSQLRSSVAGAEQQRDQANARVAERDSALAALRADIAALQALRDQLREDNARLAAQRDALGDRVGAMEKEKEAGATAQRLLSERLDGAEAEREALRQDKDKLLSETDALSSRLARIEEIYASLLAERDMLLVEKGSLERDKRTLEERSEQLQVSLEELQLIYGLVLEEKSSLTQQRDTLERERELLSGRLDDAQGQQSALERDREQLRERVREVLAELTALENAYRQRDLQLGSLREDYSTLQQKYDLLVRPARGPGGHYVVEVRYRKRGEGYEIEMREPDEPQFRVVTTQSLYARLDELKASRPEGLYTRIILPEDSGLSYNEAWDFTNEVLNRYDYYYQ